MGRRTMSLGEAAFALRIAPMTLRHYTDRKLVFATRNGVSGWRRYHPAEVERFSKVLDGLQSQEAKAV